MTQDINSVGWNELNCRLVKKFSLPSFPDALAFVIEVGKLAEAADHHPDFEINYRHVTLSLCTHDSGSVITERDRSLSQQIDQISQTAIDSTRAKLF